MYEQAEGGVLAGSFQTQAVSTISFLADDMQQQKPVWFIKTRHPDTNSSPYKTQRDTCSSLPWHETSLQLLSTSCSTEHLRKGRTKVRHLNWSKKHQEQPKFPYRSCVLEMELNIFQFTQSIQTAYFNQFIQTPTKLLPCCCCFPLDNINYTRWLSVYLCDICQPGGTHLCIKPFAMVDLLCTST